MLIVVDNLCLIVGFSFEGTSGFRGFRPKNVPMVEVVCNGMPVNMELIETLGERANLSAGSGAVARGLRDRQ